MRATPEWSEIPFIFLTAEAAIWVHQQREKIHGAAQRLGKALVGRMLLITDGARRHTTSALAQSSSSK